MRGTRAATDSEEQDCDEWVRLVRVRHAERVWEKELDWEEIAIVGEPSPGRDRARGATF